MHCPTCGAEQEWADTCRRCKSDLRLLRAADHAYEWHRLRCVRDLDLGQPHRAIRHAQACHRLRPGQSSHRLLALSHLLSEQWLEALQWAMSTPNVPEPPGE
jgi:hypothetical protein